MLKARYTHPRETTNPFHIVSPGCPSCGRYLHPMPLGSGPAGCPDCRARGLVR